MNKKQQDRLAMFHATHALLAGSPETSAIPAFAARLATFTEKLAQVAGLQAQQADPLRSQLAIRDAALADMLHATQALAGATLSHAHAQGDVGLALKVRFNPRDYGRARLTQKPTIAQQLLDAVKTVLPTAGDHGVTQPKVDAAQAKIDAAAQAVADSRTTVAAKRAATERMSTVLRETSGVLANQLDPLIAPLAKTDPDFFNRYQAVREVVNRPATRATNHAASSEITLVAPKPGEDGSTPAAQAATPTAAIKLAA